MSARASQRSCLRHRGAGERRSASSPDRFRVDSGPVKIAEIMNRSVATLSPGQTLGEVLTLLRTHRIRHLPVIDASSRLVGIVSDRDVKRATPSLLSGVDREAYERVLEETTVSQFMTRDPTCVAPETSLKAVVKILVESKVGALPVVDDGHLVGIATDIDLLQYLYDTLPEE